jgi:activator of HSP90 ATPase
MALASLFANKNSVSSSLPRVCHPQKCQDDFDEIDSVQSFQGAIDRSKKGRLLIILFSTSFSLSSETVLKDLRSMQTSISCLDISAVFVDSPAGSLLADKHKIEATPTLRFYLEGNQVHSMTTVSQDIIYPFVSKWSKKARGLVPMDA